MVSCPLSRLFPFVAQSVPEKGDREFQLSGIGTRDYECDTMTFASGSISWFLTDRHEEDFARSDKNSYRTLSC
jgi:hypothetical protein